MIVSVATQHFLDHGYSATSMSAIAAALGGSKGTLWSYFPSKEALFAAVIDHASTKFRAELTEILDPCGDLTATLRNFSLRLFEKVTSPTGIALNRLVMAEAGRFPEMGRIFYERAPRMTVALLGNFLKGAMERGQMPVADADRAAQDLMYLCNTRFHQKLLMGVVNDVSEQDKQEEVEHALQTFLRAYGPRNG